MHKAYSCQSLARCLDLYKARKLVNNHWIFLRKVKNKQFNIFKNLDLRYVFKTTPLLDFSTPREPLVWKTWQK